MRKNIKKVTFEDFKKGLMLAGYIKPNSLTELQEKKLLEKYEKLEKATFLKNK